MFQGMEIQHMDHMLVPEKVLAFQDQYRTVRSAIQDPARFVADFLGSNVFSEKNRQKAWLYSNPFRLVSKAGVAASKFTGLEDPVAAGAVAAGMYLFLFIH